MRIFLYVNETKAGAVRTAARLADRVRELGGTVVGPDEADVIVALGGDGTILRCVREFPDAPVLGFNLGGLGYLSAVEAKDFDRALSLLAGGRYRIVERTRLGFTPNACAKPRRRGGAVRGVSPQALNDIVITREMTGHAAMLDLSVDGHRPTRYLADGLVIATPTGSTAYSLSAGGPVVMPDSRSFVITPMNPHALGIRPLVVADSVRIRIASVSRADPGGRLGVYADGESVAMLAPGEEVEIAKAERVAKFVELEGYDPYAVLAHKLGWTGTSL